MKHNFIVEYFSRPLWKKIQCTVTAENENVVKNIIDCQCPKSLRHYGGEDTLFIKETTDTINSVIDYR